MTRWTRRALGHIDEIAAYYAQEAGKEVADRVLGRSQNAVQRLDDYPALGRIGRIDGTRELVVSHTLFILAYRVRRGCVDIVAVIHAARQGSHSR